MHIFKNIYDYRELLKTNVKKDIRGKYKGSFLGILWSFINPLLQVVVYWIVFPYLMRGAGGDNYLVYLITGLIPWTFFLTTVSTGTTSIKANAGIIDFASLKWISQFLYFLYHYIYFLFRIWVWNFYSNSNASCSCIDSINFDFRYYFIVKFIKCLYSRLRVYCILFTNHGNVCHSCYL